MTQLTNEAGGTRLRPVRDPQSGTKSRALLFAGALIVGGCTSTKVPGEIRNEPVCPDFELGAAKVKMKGSLEKPVQVSILEDEDEVLWERVLLGRRSPDDPAFPFVVPDDDETYQLQWAQCPNTFAPKKVELDVRVQDLRLGYTCGEAVVYSTVELQIREGDAASRVVEWVPPPEPDCWGTDAEAKDDADGAGGSAPDDPTAGDGEDSDASPPASAAPSASAVPSGSAAPEASTEPSAPAPTPPPSSPPPPPVPTPTASGGPTAG